MKSRALFVDDEPLVLSGLRRMLRSLRHDWDMSFANSGKEALEILEDGDFSVVISDMRMPEMDGASLLNEVAARHPAVARLVLSGHAELDAIMRAVRPAHQFLAKPCDPKLLESALQRIRLVGFDPKTDALCTKLGAHRRLPSTSATIDALRAALSDAPADLEKISVIVGSDIAMSIQLLRLVNSAFFGPPTKTFDPQKAVSILGADILTRLLDDVELFRPIDQTAHHGEDAVVELNSRVQELASSSPAHATASSVEIAPETLAMLSLAGPLAALETSEPLDQEGEQALGRLLLAYWGLDIDGVSATSAADHTRQSELESA